MKDFLVIHVVFSPVFLTSTPLGKEEEDMLLGFRICTKLPSGCLFTVCLIEVCVFVLGIAMEQRSLCYLRYSGLLSYISLLKRKECTSSTPKQVNPSSWKFREIGRCMSMLVYRFICLYFHSCRGSRSTFIAKNPPNFR